MKNVSTLSVVMIVKNEAKNLGDCLATVARLADEIIILDSGSTDDTATVAARYKAKFYTNTDWKGFGYQRQLAQSYASCDYVLALDADERLDSQLKESVAEVLQRAVNRERPFAFMRRNLYVGKAVHKFGYRGKLVRLYARQGFGYSDAEVHETVDCDRSQSITLKGNLMHHVCDSFHHLMEKHLRYSNDWAVERHHQGKTTWFITPFLKGIFSFLRESLLRGAILSGPYGFIMAMIGAFYSFDKYMLLYIMNHQKKKQ